MGRRPIGQNLIQLQVSDEDYADLKFAAEERRAMTRTAWTVPEEVRRRIAVSRYDVPAAMGDLARIVTTQAETLTPMIHPALNAEPDLSKLLTTVREIFASVLDDLGAQPATGQLAIFAANIAKRIRSPEPQDLSYEGRALARVGKTLGVGDQKRKQPKKGTSRE
jgi:hypothetical protein